MSKLDLRFGALSPKLKEQLGSQGFTFKDEKLARQIQDYADSLVKLHIGGFLSTSQLKICHKKLILHIVNSCIRDDVEKI